MISPDGSSFMSMTIGRTSDSILSLSS
jgi:hypothetical protein